MVRRDEAFATARASKCPKDWEKAHKLRNKVVDICTNAKNEHTNHNLQDNKDNPKKFWDNLLKLWGNNMKKGSNTINLKNTSTGLNTPVNETSNHFNEFFCNIASQIQQSIQPLSQIEMNDLTHTLQSNPRDNLIAANVPEFSFRDVTNNEVKKLVKKIENHKSFGLTGITSNLFTVAAKILVPQFKFLFNLCLRTCSFPQTWKNTIVTPLFKVGDSKLPGNYRPIACIPLPAKLLEKCIHTQLYDFLESNHLLVDEQYGFRRSKNTQQAIFNYLDNISNSLNANKSTIAIYVDI